MQWGKKGLARPRAWEKHSAWHFHFHYQNQQFLVHSARLFYSICVPLKKKKLYDLFPALLISACNLIKAALGERTLLVHNCLSTANQKMDYMCKIKHTQKVQKFVYGVFSLQATSCLLWNLQLIVTQETTVGLTWFFWSLQSSLCVLSSNTPLSNFT